MNKKNRNLYVSAVQVKGLNLLHSFLKGQSLFSVKFCRIRNFLLPTSNMAVEIIAAGFNKVLAALYNLRRLIVLKYPGAYVRIVNKHVFITITQILKKNVSTTLLEGTMSCSILSQLSSKKRNEVERVNKWIVVVRLSSRICLEVLLPQRVPFLETYVFCQLF